MKRELRGAQSRPDEDGLVSLDEAAEYLSCTVAAVRKWISQGRLPRVKLGRLTRVRRRDLVNVASSGLPARGAATSSRHSA